MRLLVCEVAGDGGGRGRVHVEGARGGLFSLLAAGEGRGRCVVGGWLMLLVCGDCFCDGGVGESAIADDFDVGGIRWRAVGWTCCLGWGCERAGWVRGVVVLTVALRGRRSRRGVPSMSTSSCTRKDSVRGFLFLRASRAEKTNCSEDRAAVSSGRDLRYCTKTRAAMYTQKDMNGFI